MGTISEKLVYLNGTKQAIKQAINEDFEVIDNNTTFREYADEISSNNAKYKDLIPKETKNATNTLDISNSSGLDKALVTQYGNTYQETTTGKNLFKETGGVSNGTYNNGLYTSNSLSSYQVMNMNGENITYIANTKYYISMDLRRTTRTGAINAINVGTTTGVVNHFPTISNEFQKYYIEFTPTSDYTSNKITVQSGNASVVFEVKNLMVSTSSDTNYEPYTNGASPNPDYPQEIQVVTGDNTIIVSNSDNTQSQSYHVSLGNIELCKIGDYKDRIYPLNGKWYLEKKIGKIVLDGSESWQMDYGTGLFNNNDLFYFTPAQSYSDYYIYNSIQSGLLAGLHNGEYALQQTSNRLFIKNTNFTNNQDFKTWLSTHNTIVYYPYKTPTTEEITESNYPTLYNQLNNIKLYEGVNHITMTNESGLDVEFDITYYKDWKLD